MTPFSRLFLAAALAVISFAVQADARDRDAAPTGCVDTDHWRDFKEAMGRRQAPAVPFSCLEKPTSTFADADSAARAALQVAVGLSRDYEYGGLVIRCGEAYAFTAPVTNKSSVSVRYRYAYPSTCSIAAMYHTHPTDSRWAGGESEADVDARRHLGVPSYVLVIRSGIVKTWR